MDIATKNRFGIIFTFILFVLLLVGQCKSFKENRRLASNVEALNDSVRHAKNDIGTITASKKVIEATAKELRKQVWVKDENLKKLMREFSEVKSATVIKEVFTVKEIPVMYRDTIPFIFERKEEVKNDWYAMKIRSNQKGVIIDSLTIPNEQYIITGLKSEGIFKPKYLEVSVTNTNPFIKTVDIQTQVIRIETPFYNKGWFRVAEMVTAFGLGVYVAK